MGEAKRRKKSGQTSQNDGSVQWTTAADPRVQKIFEQKGEMVSVALIGSGLIMPQMTSIAMDELMKPQHRVLRLAFGVYDRIRTGEITGWCGLCEAQKRLWEISCYAVVEQAKGTGPNKPAVVVPVCGQCDSISTEDTERRVLEFFPLGPPVSGGSA